MKKVLFATSALVLSAGFASAEVAVSGDGRMGMIYDGNDVQFASRARVLFTLTGESDAGLSFGAKFRVDQENYKADPYRSAARGSAGQIWISGTYGKLSMGDVVSASEAAIGDLYEVGYTDGAVAFDSEEISYLTADGNNLGQGPAVLYEYGINGFTFYASATDGSDRSWGSVTFGDNTEDEDALSNKVAYSLAAKYEVDNYNVGLGFGKHGDAKEIVLGAEGKFDQFSVKGVYAHYKDRSAVDAFAAITGKNPITNAAGANVTGDYNFKSTIGLSGAYQADALLVKAFWRQDKFTTDVVGLSNEKYNSYGIGADYDLGGGATLAGGIIDTDYLQDTVADLGIKFKF
ncbi:porin [Paracoccus aminophilus]|nr:porin [Paracoccus aminophilus]